MITRPLVSSRFRRLGVLRPGQLGNPTSPFGVFRRVETIIHNRGRFTQPDAPAAVLAVEVPEVKCRHGHQHHQTAVQEKVGLQAAEVLGGFRRGVEQRADNVAEGLADEEDCRGALFLGVAGRVGGGPRVDEGDWCRVSDQNLGKKKKS